MERVFYSSTRTKRNWKLSAVTAVTIKSTKSIKLQRTIGILRRRAPAVSGVGGLWAQRSIQNVFVVWGILLNTKWQNVLANDILIFNINSCDNISFSIAEFIIIIIIIIKKSLQCKAGREWDHSSISKTQTPHNQLVEVRKRENSGRQKEIAK